MIGGVAVIMPLGKLGKLGKLYEIFKVKWPAVHLLRRPLSCGIGRMWSSS
jgi:hypothetical protein